MVANVVTLSLTMFLTTHTQAKRFGIDINVNRDYPSHSVNILSRLYLSKVPLFQVLGASYMTQKNIAFSRAKIFAVDTLCDVLSVITCAWLSGLSSMDASPMDL